MLKNFSNEEILCVDETAFMNHNNVSYGYFKKGQQPQVTSHPRRLKENVVMAIHPKEGIVSYLSTKDSINTSSFKGFLEETLSSCPNNIKAVIMDNVSFHHSKEVMSTLKAVNIVPLFIPPYSPRCNPIEEVFSIMKRHYRALEDNMSFNEKIEDTIQNIKSYKSYESHYNHTRRHVEEQCQVLKS